MRTSLTQTQPDNHIPVDGARARPYLTAMTPDQTIDARDLLCPLPVLRLRKALDKAPPGALIRLLATDPAAAIDVPHFCAEQGHDFLGSEDLDAKTCAYTVQNRT